MKTALILVDIQNDYFTGGLWPVEEMDRVAKAAADVLQGARDAGTPVFHIQHEATSDTAPFFRPGTQGMELHESVTPLTEEAVIIKHRPNSFHQTALQMHLKKLGITHLTIIGAMSQMCIDATVRAARDLGYEVTVIANACGAKAVQFGDTTLTAPQVQAAFLSALSGTYATVI